MPKFAPFGNAIYGETVFGAPPSVNLATDLSIVPFNFDGLQLNWTPPGGNWNEQILVRSAFGIPTSVYDRDGVVLLDETSNFSVQYIDSISGGAPLKSGRFYYYGLFVFDVDVQEWFVAAVAQGLVLTDYNIDWLFETWIPQFYMDMDATLITSPGDDGPLDRFFDLLGWEGNWIRSEMESMFLFTNVNLISGAMLPYLGGNLGVEYEPVLGMTRTRVLVKNAVHLYKTRGTLEGIEAAASAFTGYGAEVTIGKNLSIQLDDSAFDRSGGHWIPIDQGNPPTPTTITPVDALSVGVFPQHGSYSPPNNENVGLITAAGGAVLQLTTCTPETAVTLGLPISGTGPITESLWIQPVPGSTPGQGQSTTYTVVSGLLGQLVLGQVPLGFGTLSATQTSARR